MAIEFRVLGPLEVGANGRLLPLGSRKQRALLALLLLHANETLSRDRLIDQLWDERPPATVESALHVYLSRLRKLLDKAGAAGALVHEPWGYRLQVGPEELDLNRFELLVDEGREALAANNPQLAAERLRDGLALWRGPPLADLQSERFALEAAARWQEERVAALEQRLEADLALGRDHELISELETLVAMHPYRERLRAQLMLALYRCGRHVDALAVYRQARQTLAAELGLEPGPELRQLERAILAADPELAAKRPRRAGAASQAAAEPTEERKIVSVLVTAVTSSRDGVELDPEDLRLTQEQHANVVRLAVERHGGCVYQLAGNTVTSVFGVPRAHEDDAERAVRAALAIRDGAARKRLRVRAGVTSGEAFVQLAGEAVAAENVVVGEVIERASLLEAAAQEGGVLIDETTYHATKHVVESAHRSQLETRGRQRVRAWQPLAAPAPPHTETPRRRRAPFVGRGSERALLVATLDRVRQQRDPELVTIIGEPGIGKSRLVDELRQARARRADDAVSWLQGRTPPYGEGVSLSALVEIVKSQAGVLDSDSDEEVEEKLGRSVESLLADGRDADWMRRKLRPLAGITDAGGAVGGDRDETFAAWRRFFEALAERRPLVLVFEDVQWADETLLDFVDGLSEWIAGVPLMVIATARPELLERRPGWGGGKHNAFTLSLSPLADRESARLLGALSHREGRTADKPDATLLARIGGNPLFAEQYARAVAEQGHPGEVPASVQAIIAARLDLLPRAEKRVLQDAAVVGKIFWAGAAAALAGLDPPAVEKQLGALEHKGYLQHALHSSIADETEYTFRHLLLRDVAYAEIPRAARAAKHRSAAAWIEALRRPQDHAEVLAHHYECALELTTAAGGDTSEIAVRARVALRDAGDRALALDAPAAAARHYERALELWPEHDAARPQLLFRYGSALSTFGDPREVVVLDRAQPLLLAAGDVEAAAEADALLAGTWWRRGGREELARHLDRAAALVRDRPPSAAKARVLTRVSRLRGFCWQTEAAIGAGREALAIADELDLGELRAEALINIGWGRMVSGDLAGRSDLERGLELALTQNALRVAGLAYGDLAAVLLLMGELQRRDEVLSEAERIETRLGASRRVRTLRAYKMGLWRADWDEVLAFADTFIAECESGLPDSFEPEMRINRAMIRLARDETDAARADCELALDQVRNVERPDVAPTVLAYAASLYLDLGDVDEARRVVDELLSYDATIVSVISPELTWAVDTLGRRDEIAEALARLPEDSLWARGGRLVLDGSFKDAADVFARMRDPWHEARARVPAAEILAKQGDPRKAAAQLEKALGFYRSVNATRYIRQAENMLAAAKPIQTSEGARV